MVPRFTAVLGAVFGLAGAVSLAGSPPLPPCQLGFRPLTDVANEFDASVSALTALPGPAGTRLAVAGAFNAVGATPAAHVAQYDGENWLPIGDGLPELPDVTALAVVDFGNGPHLFAGTRTASAAESPLWDWDGQAWASAERGLEWTAISLLYPSTLNGRNVLFVAGFTGADGAARAQVAAWDGTAWTDLSAGARSSISFTAIHTFDDGVNGPKTFLSGNLREGTEPLSLLSVLVGETWVAESAQPNCPIQSFAEFDDGNGTALYALGYFTAFGGMPVEGLARFDSPQWTEAAGGIGLPAACYPADASLVAWDDGTGPALYAFGEFNSFGGLELVGVPRWDGQQWSALNTLVFGGAGRAIDTLVLSDGAAIYSTGGNFPPYVSRYECVGPLGDIIGDGVVNAFDLQQLLGGWGGRQNDLNRDNICDLRDLGILLSNWTR